MKNKIVVIVLLLFLLTGCTSKIEGTVVKISMENGVITKVYDTGKKYIVTINGKYSKDIIKGFVATRPIMQIPKGTIIDKWAEESDGSPNIISMFPNIDMDSPISYKIPVQISCNILATLKSKGWKEVKYTIDSEAYDITLKKGETVLRYIILPYSTKVLK